MTPGDLFDYIVSAGTAFLVVLFLFSIFYGGTD